MASPAMPKLLPVSLSLSLMHCLAAAPGVSVVILAAFASSLPWDRTLRISGPGKRQGNKTAGADARISGRFPQVEEGTHAACAGPSEERKTG